MTGLMSGFVVVVVLVCPFFFKLYLFFTTHIRTLEHYLLLTWLHPDLKKVSDFDSPYSVPGGDLCRWAHIGLCDCSFRSTSKPLPFAFFPLEEYVVCSISQCLGVMATHP